MDDSKLIEILKNEGFTNIFIHSDPPNAYYDDHTHSKITAHIVLKGEITLNLESISTTYKPYSRFDVPAGQVHSANIGNDGCTYIIGEK
ncbi:MAG: hypothetical protein GTO02_07255 [Candidatus Dadabacteria bacterium]|nr:hypothetical protein [Candidatus Dadabacteria bacterium]NIQ14192.1 hypothetical protein [Candidatus Dadabacteria bacterium]